MDCQALRNSYSDERIEDLGSGTWRDDNFVKKYFDHVRVAVRLNNIPGRISFHKSLLIL
jgi:hypothetical protein